MNKKFGLKVISSLLVISMLLVGCGKKETPSESKQELSETSSVSSQAESTPVETSSKEESTAPETEKVKLFVYSGAGLKKPMEEIKEVYEKEHNVEIEYSFAGSTQLIGQLELEQSGDVFIVGAINAYKTVQEKGLANEYQTVAYHNPIIAVPKDNPAGIESLEDLAKPGVRVVLGDENANAIGKTTQKIIEKNGLEGINENVITKTAMLNELIIHITNGDADAGIVTEDSVFGNENVKTIAIPEKQNVPQILPIGTLTCTEHNEEAQAFVDFVASDEGKAIFEKYGFPPVKE